MLGASLLLGVWCLGFPLRLHAQGPLAPPGAPSPSMKSLDQIEARTPISSLPFTISSSGSYYLTNNLSVSAGNAITITANGVTLDLNGFTISSTANPAAGTGIYLPNASQRDITILNGHIRGGVVVNGGTYSGSGFIHGIFGISLINARVTGVSVAGCLSEGISLYPNSTTIVESCTVMTVGDLGIYASTVKDSVASDTGNSAISADQVSDCRGRTNSLGGARAGISATTVENSSGFSNGTGFGINCEVATNSFGFSDAGTGINATAVSNCEGGSNSGTGIAATNTQNSVAMTGSGTALNVYGMAMNCYASGGNVGINISQNALINCLVTASITGITAGNNCLILGNTLIGNSTGVHVTGNSNRLDGNRVSGTGNAFVFDGSSNFIIRNTVRENNNNPFILNVTGNHYGPLVNVSNQAEDISSVTNANHPWANFIY